MRNLLLLGFVTFFMAFMVLPNQKAHADVCTFVEEKIVGDELKACIFKCPAGNVIVVPIESDKPCPRTINRSPSI